MTTLEDLKDLIQPNNPCVKNFALAFVNEILHHRIPEYLLISLQNMKESGKAAEEEVRVATVEEEFR